MGKQVGISVDVADREIIIQFDRELDYVVFSPKQALELAEAIANKVMSIEGKSPIVIPS